MDKYFKAQDVVNGCSILDLIGEGRYGIVYLAENEKGEKCVIKQLKVKTLKQSRDKLFCEETILKQLNNPCFPKFISTFKDEYREGYILEYIAGKVFEDIVAVEGHRFTREEIYDIANRLVGIVEILQSGNIVHRDIRLPNVILKENNELALIDFGLARFIDNQRYVKEQDYWYIGDFLIHLY
jgi:serine/threonine-protein kinase